MFTDESLTHSRPYARNPRCERIRLDRKRPHQNIRERWVKNTESDWERQSAL